MVGDFAAMAVTCLVLLLHLSFLAAEASRRPARVLGLCRMVEGCVRSGCKCTIRCTKMGSLGCLSVKILCSGRSVSESVGAVYHKAFGAIADRSA